MPLMSPCLGARFAAPAQGERASTGLQHPTLQGRLDIPQIESHTQCGG